MMGLAYRNWEGPAYALGSRRASAVDRLSCGQAPSGLPSPGLAFHGSGVGPVPALLH